MKTYFYNFFSAPQIDVSLSREWIQQQLAAPPRSSTALGQMNSSFFTPIRPEITAQVAQSSRPGTSYSEHRPVSSLGDRHFTTVPTLADLHLQEQEELHRMKYQVWLNSCFGEGGLDFLVILKECFLGLLGDVFSRFDQVFTDTVLKMNMNRNISLRCFRILIFSESWKYLSL